VKHHLEKHSKVLHRLQLAKIQKRDIASCIIAVRENSGGVTGNRVRASLSGFFGWAVSVGLLDTNPVVGTEPTEEATRDRFLKAEELKLIWNALGDDHYGSIVKILALTRRARAALDEAEALPDGDARREPLIDEGDDIVDKHFLGLEQ
jgi:hypothetical protein